MKLLYIDNSEIQAAFFKAAVSELNAAVSFSWFSETRLAVIHLLSGSAPVDFILINDSLSDILVKDLVRFIRKQDQLLHTRIVIVSASISSRDVKKFLILGVDRCIKSEYTKENWVDIVKSLQ